MAKDSRPQPKRRLRNPETVRERAVKAREQTVQPDNSAKLGRASRKLLAPAGTGLSKVFNRQPFKLIGLILFPPYFRSSWRELRGVTWPNFKETRQLTLAVMIFAIIFGILIAIVDWGLDKLFKQVILK